MASVGVLLPDEIIIFSAEFSCSVITYCRMKRKKMFLSYCKIILIILIFLLVIVISLAFSARISGGNDESGITARDIYDHLTDYADEVGTSKHIEEYIGTIHDMGDIPNISLDYETENNSGIKYKKLYQIIKNVLRRNHYEHVNDFIFSNGIKYVWFLPAELRREIMTDERLKHKVFTDYAIKTNLEKHLFPHDVPSTELNKIVDKISGLGRMYVKFRPEIVKKLLKMSGGAKKSQNTTVKSIVNSADYDSIIMPDVLGFDAVLWQLAGKIREKIIAKKTAQKYSSVSEQLADINLISMQYKDPIAVYNFIKRIKPIIKHFDEDYTGILGKLGTSSITADLLAEQRDIMRAKWEKERAEKEKYKLKHELDIMRGKLMDDFGKPAESWSPVFPPSAPPLHTPPPYSPEYSPVSFPPDKPHFAISDSAVPPGLWDGGRKLRKKILH